MAQAFARLGSVVTLVDQAAQVLPQEDADAAAIVAGRAGARRRRARAETRRSPSVRQQGDGIVVRLDRAAARQRASRAIGCSSRWAVRRTSSGSIFRPPASRPTRPASPSTIACARRTRAIFAAGDVCSRFKFTHAADAAARIVIRNALFFGRARASALVIPWCTYTDPEVAHVGLSCRRGRGASGPGRDDHHPARRSRSRGGRRGARRLRARPSHARPDARLHGRRRHAPAR